MAADLRDGMKLVPLEDDDLDSIVFPTGKSATGFTHLSSELTDFLGELSLHGKLVYLETEYFGGMGSQCAVAFEDGSIVPKTMLSGEGSINTALKAIGIVSTSDSDEFDYIGLALHRSTSDWKEVSK